MAKDYNTTLDKSDIKQVESYNLDKKSKSKKAKISITRDMLIADLVEQYPQVVPMIMDLGVHCIGCGAAMFETLEQGFAGHGIPDDEIDTIVKELNEFIEENPE